MAVTFPEGFLASATTAGIKPSGKPDLCLIALSPGAPDPARQGAAIVLTRNAVVGAPVLVARRVRAAMLSGRGPAPRAVLINSGNSNAATGDRGLRDAQETAALAAARLGVPPEAVLPSSTGVIGRPLPVGKIAEAIPSLVGALARGPEADAAAARAIMTTDLVPKSARASVDLAGHRVRIGAIAKGSGMIAPRLDSAFGPPSPQATMLAFITTDAAVDAPTLQRLIEPACAASFNRISVDNHPSCSDTVAVLASGMARGPGGGPVPPIRPGTPEAEALAAALAGVCQDLAEQVVRDGEGATRTFRVTVRGAATDAAAEAMARQVVDSPLVKCAIHGRDPNWGRIVTAAGNAGHPFDPAEASLTIGPVEVYRAGVPIPAALTDPALAQAMASARVELALTVGRGPGASWMIGCDLSAGYVSINADYTT
ncbi:MAG: hypothetical protein C0475_00410 [Planctomyces sp.]|nr:hypothetical protein [Planctomyces sp.]